MAFDNFSEYEKKYLVELFKRILDENDLNEKEKSKILESFKLKINCKSKYKNISMSNDELITYFTEKDSNTKKTIYYYILYYCLYFDIYSLKQYELLSNIEKIFMISERTKKNLYRLAYEKLDIENKISNYLINEYIN